MLGSGTRIPSMRYRKPADIALAMAAGTGQSLRLTLQFFPEKFVMPTQCFNRCTEIAVVVALIVFSGSIARAQDEKNTAGELEIYNLAQLLNKAAHIVVAEVGATKDGLTELVLQDVLKTPETNKKEVDPEVLKRADAMLDALSKDKDAKMPLVKPQGLKLIRILAGTAKLPAQGNAAVFVLWERVERPKDSGDICYAITHPQNVYDLDALPQIRAGIIRPRAVADGRYLRRWDREMADHVRQRKLDAELLEMKGGSVELGLKIVPNRVTLSLSKDNSFSITGAIENTRPQAQTIYDGPAGGYGVRLKPKNGGKAYVLRLSMRTLVGVDSSILSIPEPADFSTINGNGRMNKDLQFDARDFPILKNLSGEFQVSLFYISSLDGATELDEKAWTGTIVSEDITLRFEGTAANRP
jgi:hypothetical protein